MPSGCIIHSAGISKENAGVSVPDCLPSARTRLNTERNPCVWGTLRALRTESDSRRRLGVLESVVKRTSAHMYFEKEMGSATVSFNSSVSKNRVPPEVAEGDYKVGCKTMTVRRKSRERFAVARLPGCSFTRHNGDKGSSLSAT